MRNIVSSGIVAQLCKGLRDAGGAAEAVQHSFYVVQLADNFHNLGNNLFLRSGVFYSFSLQFYKKSLAIYSNFDLKNNSINSRPFSNPKLPFLQENSSYLSTKSAFLSV